MRIFLRHRRLILWAPNSPEASAVRSVASQWRRDQSDRSDRSDQTDLTDLSDQQRWSLYSPWLDHADAAIRANAIICLIHQANYLLDLQIDALERDFIDEGGYSEQLATARLRKRSENRSQSNANENPSIPACPNCGGQMALRTAKEGRNAGSQFWGCVSYPQCTGTSKV